MPFKSHVCRVGSDRVKLLPEEEQTVIPDTHEAIINGILLFPLPIAIGSCAIDIFAIHFFHIDGAFNLSGNIMAIKLSLRNW